MQILKIKYYDDLIVDMLSSAVGAVVSSNIIASLIVVILLHSYIPDIHIFLWFSIQASIGVSRLWVGYKLSSFIKKQDKKSIKKYLSIYIAFISLSALSFGSIIYASFFYEIPEQVILIVGVIIIALTSGSIATLGTVFISFVAYMTFSIWPLIIALIIHGEMLYYVYAFVIFIFYILHIASGKRLFLRHQKSIEYEREIKQLNSDLSKRIEGEVEKSRKKDKEIMRQSRLIQMGEMLSMIAHQWRQPLSAISATSSSLELKATLGKLDKDSVLKNAKNISKYTQHLSSTINDFRNFFKLNKTKTDISFTKLVEKSLSIIEVSMKTNNIILELKLNSTKTLNIYENEVNQVLLNILKNAEDVLIERDIANPKITIESKGMELFISDNAGGIPVDIIDSIFEPYFSTKTQNSGTGLGLYMSKIIIDEHCDGELSVKNNDDGAVFKIKLEETYD